jgi:hypothetical protein
VFLLKRNLKNLVGSVEPGMKFLSAIARWNRLTNKFSMPANLNLWLIPTYQSVDEWPDSYLAPFSRTGKMPVPQKVIFLVGWASCPPIKDLLTMVQDVS